MTASGHDQRTRECWRLSPTPALTRVFAVIAAVALAVALSGCRGPSGGQRPSGAQGPSGGQGPTANSPSAAPSASPTYRATARVVFGKNPLGVAVDPGSQTVYVPNRGDNAMSVIAGS